MRIGHLNMFTTIYTLHDPAERDHVRYVGITSMVPPSKRLTDHIQEARLCEYNTATEGSHIGPKNRWICDLLNAGRTPVMTVVWFDGLPEIVKSRALAEELERTYIKLLLLAGHDLLNTAGRP